MDIESLYGEQEAALSSLKPSTKLLVKILLGKRGDPEGLVTAAREWTIKKSKERKHVSVPR